MIVEEFQSLIRKSAWVQQYGKTVRKDKSGLRLHANFRSAYCEKLLHNNFQICLNADVLNFATLFRAHWTEHSLLIKTVEGRMLRTGLRENFENQTMLFGTDTSLICKDDFWAAFGKNEGINKTDYSMILEVALVTDAVAGTLDDWELCHIPFRITNRAATVGAELEVTLTLYGLIYETSKVALNNRSDLSILDMFALIRRATISHIFPVLVKHYSFV